MQTIQSVKMQSQIHNTGSTSDHIQDMKMIAPLHTERETTFNSTQGTETQHSTQRWS
jgi:hypothetical protein